MAPLRFANLGVDRRGYPYCERNIASDMNFPNNSIKGIPNKDFLIDGMTIGSHLFYFSQPRDDGKVEQSINWEDDDSVIGSTLSQEREDGSLQFNAGVAVLPRSEIDRLNKRPAIRGLLSYERSPLNDNPYHGNLLLQANVPKAKMRQIAAGLALAVFKIIPQTLESTT